MFSLAYPFGTGASIRYAQRRTFLKNEILYKFVSIMGYFKFDFEKYVPLRTIIFFSIKRCSNYESIKHFMKLNDVLFFVNYDQNCRWR